MYDAPRGAGRRREKKEEKKIAFVDKDVIIRPALPAIFRAVYYARRRRKSSSSSGRPTRPSCQRNGVASKKRTAAGLPKGRRAARDGAKFSVLPTTAGGGFRFRRRT